MNSTIFLSSLIWIMRKNSKQHPARFEKDSQTFYVAEASKFMSIIIHMDRDYNLLKEKYVVKRLLFIQTGQNWALIQR